MKSIVLICCAAALLAAGVSIFVAGQHSTALISAVAMLVCAQIVAMLVAQRPREIDDAKLASLSDRIKRNSAEIERLSTRTRDQAQALSAMEQAMTATRRAGGNDTAGQFPLMESPASLAPISAPLPDVSVLRAVQPREASAPVAPRSRPALHLEPVVRVGEGRTAYYKASLQRPAEGPGRPAGLAVSADLALAEGAASQWDPQHDVTLMSEVIPILQTLRARRGATGILVPVSLATFDDSRRLQALVDMLYQHPDAAAGLVLDIHVSALAALSGNAMQGLAWLASQGASFCLTGPWVSGNDLPSLAELGFTFLDVPHDQLVSVPAARQMLAQAASVNFSVIASGVTDAGHAAAILPAGALARGPAYAMPRAVRPGLSGSSIQQQVA